MWTKLLLAVAVLVPNLQGMDGLDYTKISLDDYGVYSANLAGGSEECRCLTDVHSFLNETAPQMLEPISEWSCDGFSDGLTCLPAGYGQAGCQAYDDKATRGAGASVSRVCQGSEVPRFCANQFCYVDARKCRSMRSLPAEYLFNGRRVPSSSGLQYSYHTCGFLDFYSHESVSTALLHTSIRVTAPIVGQPTVHLRSGQGQGPWHGPTWWILEKMFSEQNMSVEIVPLTVEAMQNAPYYHPWWACVHMVTTNMTDICVGDFWASESRRVYMLPDAGFTSAIAVASSVFVTTQPESSSGMDWEWSNPLRPFTYQLWGAIAGCMVLLSLAYSTAEVVASARRDVLASSEPVAKQPSSQTKVGDVEAKLLPLGMRAMARSVLWDANYLRTKAMSDSKEVLRGLPDSQGATLLDSVYQSITCIFKTDYRPRSHGGRIIKVVFTCFMLIVVQFWNSLITTGLVVETVNVVSGSQNLAQASDAGERVCVHGWLGEDMRNKKVFPSISNSWDRSKVAASIVQGKDRGGLDDSLQGSLRAMDEGYCQHMVVDLDSFTYSLALDRKHCNKGVIGAGVSRDIPIAFPIRKDKLPQVSAWLTSKSEEYATMLQQEYASLNLECDPFFMKRYSSADSPPSMRPARWQIQNMTTEFLIVLISSVVAIAVSHFAPWVPAGVQGIVS
eukprot:CAMPEP_0114309762 /NCGR_PEP_ID=MMETSP0059-20121206/18830_1 /TAXON_ID=36894 /ORGANISM="Pyramimonas parkeae, Strain CCMP726" /LENGTH=672 /DNA_ID=CAMNT_0001433623 /DNA_START=98 /DNA_END=2116 /DNA_ORIENTATION=-